MRSVTYREFEVPPALRRHLQCVWRLRDEHPSKAVQTIYPDGRCEIMVHLGHPPRCQDTLGDWHQQAQCLFAAQRMTALRLEAMGPIDCLGVRLTPAASAALAGAGSAGLRDQVVDLALIDMDFGLALVTAAKDFIAGSEAALWQLLETRLARADLDPRIELAVERMERSAGNERMERTASAVGLSLRALQVNFRRTVGLGPKEYARVLRLQATLRALDENTSTLSEIAADGGFADQAHATRELRRATGLTLARLRSELQRDRHGDTAIRLAAAFVRGHA